MDGGIFQKKGVRKRIDWYILMVVNKVNAVKAAAAATNSE